MSLTQEFGNRRWNQSGRPQLLATGSPGGEGRPSRETNRLWYADPAARLEKRGDYDRRL